MRISFDPRAVEDLDRIFAWIARDNPAAAHRVVSRIEAKVSRLAFPEIGRPGRVEGTRELVVPPYVIVYRIDWAGDGILVVGVFHGAQDRSP